MLFSKNPEIFGRACVMKLQKAICYREEFPVCRMDLYLPEKPEAVLLYFHGGVLEGGSRSDHEPQFRQLAESGIAAASPAGRGSGYARLI